VTREEEAKTFCVLKERSKFRSKSTTPIDEKVWANFEGFPQKRVVKKGKARAVAGKLQGARSQ